MSSSAFDGVNSVERVFYHGTREPSSCSKSNHQISGIDFIHIVDKYQCGFVCSFPIYAHSTDEFALGKLRSGDIAGISIGVAALVIFAACVIYFNKKQFDRKISKDLYCDSHDTTRKILI